MGNIKLFTRFNFGFSILQKSESDVRVSFLPNVAGGKYNVLNKAILASMLELPNEKAVNVARSLLRGDSAIKILEKGDKLDLPVSI